MSYRLIDNLSKVNLFILYQEIMCGDVLFEVKFPFLTPYTQHSYTCRVSILICTKNKGRQPLLGR